MKETYAQAARAALEILNRDGWCKRALTLHGSFPAAPYREGSHCIGGAVNIAMFGNDMWHGDSSYLLSRTGPGDDLYAVLAGKIRELYPELAGDAMPLARYRSQDTALIARWNNHPGISEADVRQVLEKIAAED